MGYNQANYRRIREEYEHKYRFAREAADRRREEVHARVPGLAELDRELAATGPEIMRVTLCGGEDREKNLARVRERNELLLRARGEMLRQAGYPEDYTAVRYECEKCGDSGFTDGGMCTCMKRALTLAGYESSGIGELLRTQTFERFSLSYFRSSPEQFERMSHNLQVMKQFAHEFSADKMKNLLLTGSTGLGKTHLSSAAARVIIDRGFDVQYVTAVGLLSDFEFQRFGSGMNGEEGENVGRYYGCDLLIIDDLGTEVINQFTLSCLYNVINIRLTKRKSTLINTNLTPKEIREKYWDRIASRLFGEYYLLTFTGTDVRRAKIGQS